MSHDGEGATRTSATVHMLFNEEWGYEVDHVMELRPTCGRWNCLVMGHWSPVRRVSDRERLKRWASLLEQLLAMPVGSLRTDVELELKEWRLVSSQGTGARS